MKIMAVDDEFLALEDFEDTCREVCITDEIIKFNNPLDALGYVATNKIDIAFLDIEMPVIKGIELAKTVDNLSLLIIINILQIELFLNTKSIFHN